MTMSTLNFIIVIAMTLLAMTSSSHGVTVIDLSYQLKQGESFGWPVHPAYNFTVVTRGHNPLFNGWLEMNKFEMGEHIGTHMDAPAHGAKDAWRMHDIPPSRLVGPGVVIDVTEKANVDPVYRVTVDDLQKWEGEHGKIPNRAIVLVKTGWGSRYPHKKRVFNTDDWKDANTYRFPGVSAEAAGWLADKRNINALGTDTPSPDVGHDHKFPVHKLLLRKDILILENVANVDSLPPKGTTIVMGAINIYDGSGAPMRILALKDIASDAEGSNGSWKLQASTLTLATVVLGLSFVGFVY